MDLSPYKRPYLCLKLIHFWLCWIFIAPCRLSLVAVHGEYWTWRSNTSVTWHKELTHWERPWCWERLKAGGGRDNRRWDGWISPPIQWTWTWADSGRWLRTGRLGVLQSLESQNWVTELKLCLTLATPWTPASGSLFQWVSSPHQVAKVLELQLQHWSF